MPLLRRQILGSMAGLAAFRAFGDPGKPAFATIAASQWPVRLTVQLFFAYVCPHCWDFEPAFERWAAGQPADVKIRRIPVAWTERDDYFVRTYYAFEALGELSRLHRLFFDEVVHGKVRIAGPMDAMRWVRRHGVQAQAWSQAWTDARTRLAVAQARSDWTFADIEATPSIVVASRYRTSPGLCGSLAATVSELDALVDRARREIANPPARAAR